MSKKPNPTHQWFDYMVILCDFGHLQRTLIEHGEAGWHMASCQPTPKVDSQWTIVFEMARSK